jgi:hypothetical protein
MREEMTKVIQDKVTCNRWWGLENSPHRCVRGKGHSGRLHKCHCKQTAIHDATKSWDEHPDK